MRSPTLLLALAVALSACTAGSAPQSPAPRSVDRLTFQEIAASPHRDLLSAVRALRPSFLYTRGGIEGREVVTYIDGVRVQNGAELLATLPVESVVEVRHLSAIDASTRYGIGHTAGAILVITHRNRGSRSW